MAISIAVAIISWDGFIKTFKKYDLFFGNILAYQAPIALFIGTGAIRVIIKFAKFSRWHNIGFKMMFFANAMCSFMIGFSIMYTDKLLTNGLYP